MLVHEGAERRVTWQQAVRADVMPRPSASKYSAIQCSPGSSPSSVLHTKAAGIASIVVGSPSLGTTPRKINLVRGSFASSLAICRVSISVVVDDVAALVYFQHGLELGVGDDVHGVRQRVAEMQLYAQVALLYQMEAWPSHWSGVRSKPKKPCR